MEASKRTGSEITDSTWPKKPRHPSKYHHDQRRSKTRIQFGDAFGRWRQLKAQTTFKMDAELADFLLNSLVSRQRDTAGKEIQTNGRATAVYYLGNNKLDRKIQQKPKA